MENEELQNNMEFGSEAPAESAAPAKDKPVLTPEEKKAKNAKAMTVITYSVALLCMLAGLFAPLFGSLKEIAVMDRMFLKYVPGVINALLFPFVKKNIIPLPENGFFVPFGEPEKFVSEHLALTIYVLMCVIGLFMLIPVLLGKANKRTSAVCAYSVELLAALSSGYYIFSALRTFTWGSEWQFFNLIIVFGGALLMMTVQSIYNKGGLGVTKIALAVFSFLVFAFLTSLVFLPEGATKAFNSLSKALKCGDDAAFAIFRAQNKAGIAGIDFIETLKRGSELGLTITDKIFVIVYGALVCVLLFNFAYDVFEIVTGTKYDGRGVLNANKPMSVIAIIRYVLALLLAAAAIVLLIILKEAKPGVYLYIVTILIAIQLVFAIVRAVVLASKRKKAVKADAVEVKPEEAPVFEESFNFGGVDAEYEDEEPDTITIETPVYEEEYIYGQPVYGQPAQEQPAYGEPAYAEPEYRDEPVYEDEPEYEEEPVYEDEPANEEEPVYEDEPEEEPSYEPAPQPRSQQRPQRKQPETEERTYVYNYRPVYNGPSDAFMDTLDDAEKIEFVQTFVEKTRGQVKGVPDYVIGQENSSFFPSVFIHINRSRELVSTHLLEKIYKHIGKNKN